MIESYNIGIDILGGDNAPECNLNGVHRFVANHPDLLPSVSLFLFGEIASMKQGLGEELCAKPYIHLIDCKENIGYNEHPVKAFLQKQESSIVKGFGYLKAGKIDVFASAGNTGAMMVGSTQVIGNIEGISRPVITSILPRESGNHGVILDVGINADCKPEMLNQFAVIGSIYSEFVRNIENPKVGLLNIGEEEEKGNLLTKAAHKLLKENNRINFIGNIESRGILNDGADVIVCDGFTGNIILKQAESFHEIITKRGIKDEYFDLFNYESYGGTPVLGINSNVIIAHGISNDEAICSMIKMSYDVSKIDLPRKIKEAMNSALV